MEIRRARPADLDLLDEIDATIQSAQYFHLDRSGEGFGLTWRLEERPLREPRTAPNRLDDDRRFLVRQITIGADDGIAIVAEHDDQLVALLIAQEQTAHRTLRLHDLRVDFDGRRQGIATAMLFQAIAAARDRELRAVTAETLTDNAPAARLLSKCGFEIAGIDTQRHSNHDLVKESATLIWYVALD